MLMEGRHSSHYVVKVRSKETDRCLPELLYVADGPVSTACAAYENIFVLQFISHWYFFPIR